MLWVAKVRYLSIFHVFFFFAASNKVPKQPLYRAKNYGFLFERLDSMETVVKGF